MDLCIYTDSVADLSFEAALDLAVEVGCTSICPWIRALG